MFEGSFKGAYSMSQGCFREVYRMLQKGVVDVSGKFQVCFKKVSRKIKGCVKGVYILCMNRAIDKCAKLTKQKISVFYVNIR